MPHMGDAGTLAAEPIVTDSADVARIRVQGAPQPEADSTHHNAHSGAPKREPTARWSGCLPVQNVIMYLIGQLGLGSENGGTVLPSPRMTTGWTLAIRRFC